MRAKRDAPLWVMRAKRAGLNLAWALGRACRAGGRKLGMRYDWNLLDVWGVLMLPHPPARQGRPFAMGSFFEGTRVWDGRFF